MLERALPGREVLAQRLFAHSQELADARRHLQRYHDLVVATQQRLGALAGAVPDGAWRELNAFLEHGLAEVLATESADALTIMDDMLKVVSARVTVRPSGHAFYVEGHDTLLQAGLKAGLKLNYGCGNGTCGLCKARVISGEVVKVTPFDYPLSEAERLQGHTLLCAHSAGSADIVIETLEARGPREIPEQELVGARAQRAAARGEHRAPAPANPAHEPPALSRRPERDAVRRRRRHRRAADVSGRELSLRRPQPALSCRPRPRRCRWRKCCSVARSGPATR